MTPTKKTARPTVKKKQGTAQKRKKITPVRNRKADGFMVNTLIPLVIICIIVVCLGFLFAAGYKTVAASSFFKAKKVEVVGNAKVSQEDIEKIVREESDREGVLNSDIEKIKSNLEKISYIRSSSVSRILPDGFRVNIIERKPKAMVRIGENDFWVDDEAVLLGAVGKNETRPPIMMRGWDESKTERAQKENRERIGFYESIKQGWENAGLAKRVSDLDLTDLQDVVAVVRDSGYPVSVALGKEDFNKRLQKALEVVEGKGQLIESVISHGGNIVAKYRSGDRKAELNNQELQTANQTSVDQNSESKSSPVAVTPKREVVKPKVESVKPKIESKPKTEKKETAEKKKTEAKSKPEVKKDKPKTQN